MIELDPELLIAHFRSVSEPRMTRTRRHHLIDILVIALLAVISGCDGWTEVAAYGRRKKKWFQTFLELPAGIPSHDTFGRVFSRIQPSEFQACYESWLKELAADQTDLTDDAVAIDGKTLRGSLDRGGEQTAVHLVSAWATKNRLLLGQVAVDAKSNEITAIPELLKKIDVSGSVVTLDAMGCQKSIAADIRAAGADYVLALKANHETLHQEVEDYLLDSMEKDFAGVPHTHWSKKETGHGRRERREVYAVAVPESLRQRTEWQDLRSLVLVVSERADKHGAKEEKGTVRFYLSSLKPQARRLAGYVRGHWGIENGFHWVLDVCFREDHSRIRKDHGPENFALLRRLALTILKQDSQFSESVRCKRLCCGFDNDYLTRILLGFKGN